jgi:hypothetical protein
MPSELPNIETVWDTFRLAIAMVKPLIFGDLMVLNIQETVDEETGAYGVKEATTETHQEILMILL